jgi:Flp pilus assembly protein TadD
VSPPPAARRGGAPCSRRDLRLAAAVGAALVLLTLAAYAGVASNGFVSFDDDVLITANRAVRQGLGAKSLAWAFTTAHTGNWHPVTWLSHMLDVQLFGVRPGPHHLVSLGLHAANALLLLALLGSLTGALWPSALVAALFALHPLHVESVAWAAERKDVLSTLFALAAAVAYVRAARRGRVSRSAALPLLFALALMAKPMPVTLPFVLLLLDWWPLGRWGPDAAGAGTGAGWLRRLPPLHLWREKSLLFLLSAASAALTFLVQRGHGAMEYSQGIPLEARIANALLSPARYLAKAVLPTDLAFLYPLAAAPPARWLWAGSALALLAATALILRGARRRPWLGVGWLWFLGSLVPVLGLVQVGAQAMADRYTYLPLTGVFLAVSWQGAALARSRRRRPLALAAALATLAALAALTRAQVGVWHDSERLYRHALGATAGNWVAHDHLATALAASGNEPDAVRHYREALRIRPGEPRVLGNLGALLLRRGDVEEAGGIFNGLLRDNPLNAEVHYNLAVGLERLGREEEAIAHYCSAVAAKPGFPEAWSNLGGLLLRRGRAADATASLLNAVGADPELPEAQFNLGVALVATGRLGEAVPHLQQAARLRPDDVASQVVLGDVLLRTGRAPAAADSFRRALRLDPQARAAADGLARALASGAPDAPRP